MTKEDLKLIFIRAQDEKGNWDSLSLQELIEMGQTGQAQLVDWMVKKLVIQVLGIEDNQKVDAEFVASCIEKLEALGVGIVRINPEFLKVAELNEVKK